MSQIINIQNSTLNMVQPIEPAPLKPKIPENITSTRATIAKILYLQPNIKKKLKTVQQLS